jgi:DNA-binding NarL/FixJ family response regulator
MKNKIKVFLVDDHVMVRQGLRTYLTANPSIIVAGEASCEKETLAGVKKFSPDVVIMDINMPRLDVYTLIPAMCSSFPETKILIYSMYTQEEQVLKTARCGARGYVMKDQPAEDLVKAIKHVYGGGLYFPDSMVHSILTGSPEPKSGDALSAREKQVLALIAEGLSSKEVATRIGITPRTIDAHRASIARKLKINTIAELTKYAIKQGITSVD